MAKEKDKAPAKAAPKMKPLSRLRNGAKGKIRHVEIHPGKNSDGSQAFRTVIHREHPPEMQKQMEDAGRYMPDPPPDETLHEDGQDMLDHVARACNIKRGAGGDEDESEGEED